MRHWDLWVEVPGAAVSVTCDSRDRGMLNETRGPPSAFGHLDHRCFDRHACPEYAIQRNE
jgi:hypothetical protein